MLTLGLTTAASVQLETMRNMWKIEVKAKTPGGKVLTTSKYPTQREAERAANQLRLIAYGWKSTPRHEKTSYGKFPLYNYTVTDPVQC